MNTEILVKYRMKDLNIYDDEICLDYEGLLPPDDEIVILEKINIKDYTEKYIELLPPIMKKFFQDIYQNDIECAKLKTANEAYEGKMISMYKDVWSSEWGADLHIQDIDSYNKKKPRVILQVFNECGYNSTSVDIIEVIQWMNKHYPEVIREIIKDETK